MPSAFFGWKPSWRISAMLLTDMAAANASTSGAVSIMNRQLAPEIAA